MSAPAALACAKIVFPDTEEYDITEKAHEVALVSATNGSVYTVSTIDEEHKENHFPDTNDAGPGVVKEDKSFDKEDGNTFSRKMEAITGFVSLLMYFLIA
jgi:uncharacterized protein YaiI (UPF0178 family)